MHRLNPILLIALLTPAFAMAQALDVNEVVGREISFFAGDVPTSVAVGEVVGREVSLYTGEIPTTVAVGEVVGREVSLYAGVILDFVPIREVIGPEISVEAFAQGEGPTVMVTTLTDIADGDTSSVQALAATPGADGVISLREAIVAANNTEGPQSIEFAATGTIVLTANLPAIADTSGGLTIKGSESLTIDGGDAFSIIRINSADNIIEGLTVVRALGSGLLISGASAEGNVVRGCNIGTDGTTAMPNGTNGIEISVGAAENYIGGTASGWGNIIAGNAESGIRVVDAGLSNLIQGNIIGMAERDGAAIPNQRGIWVSGTSYGTIIGGSDIGAANMISGNTGAGVLITGDFPRSTTLVQNSIHGNGGLGIEQSDDIRPFVPVPTITQLDPVQGLRRSAVTIELFADDGDEGRIYLGSAYPESGETFTFDIDLTPYAGMNLTATGTDHDFSTSVFSEPFAIDSVNEDDTTPPVITLNGGDEIIECGGIFADPGATATDDVDGNISGSVVVGGQVVDTSTTGNYTITYDVSDAAGNAAVRRSRMVTVVDSTPPLLTLFGGNISLVVGDTFTDPGAEATDACDGDLTPAIVIGGDVVDTNTPGNYTLIYSVADGAGNAAQQRTRSVTVLDGEYELVVVDAVNFGDVLTGRHANVVVELLNNGNEVISGTASTNAPFTIVSGASYQIPPQHRRPVVLRFNANAVGVSNGTLRLTGGGGPTVALTGTGVQSTEPVLLAGPSENHFGTVRAGRTRSIEVEVQNISSGILTGTATTTAPFSVVSPNYSLGAGESAVLTVAFSPATAGKFTGELALSGGGGTTVALAGTVFGGVGTVRGSITDINLGSEVVCAGVVARADGEIIAVTSTDRFGEYEFDALASGEVSIEVYAQGYFFDQAGVVVADGAQRSADIGLTAESGGGNIQGIVTDAVSKSALGGVRVDLFQDNQPIAAAFTCDAGAYEVPLAAVTKQGGPLKIQFQADAYEDEAFDVEVDTSESTQLDVGMIPKSAFVGTVLGRVINGLTNQPVANAAVRVQGRGAFAQYNTETDAQGYYIVPDLGEGQYEITFQTLEKESTRQSISVLAGVTRTVDVELPPGDGTGKQGCAAGHAGEARGSYMEEILLIALLVTGLAFGGRNLKFPRKD